MIAISTQNRATDHVPVLLEEAVTYLAVQPDGRYVGCTLGGGGQSRAILEAASPGGFLLGTDADPEAVGQAAERLEPFEQSVKLVESNYRELRRV